MNNAGSFQDFHIINGPVVHGKCVPEKNLPQIERLAEEAGPLVEALPRALRRAVANDKVPNDLREDVLWLASIIEPHVARVKSEIAKLPQKADKALEKADQFVDNASKGGVLLFVLISCFLMSPEQAKLNRAKSFA